MGDFNCDINPKNMNSIIRSFAESSGLKIIPHGSTHFTSSSETFIDLIMVDQNDSILNFNSYAHINNHYLVDVSIEIFSPISSTNNLRYQDFKKNLDENLYLSELSKID